MIAAAAFEVLFTKLVDVEEVRFVEATDGGDADFKAEAVWRRNGDEGAGFLVSVFREPFNELCSLFERNFLREGFWMWFVHKVFRLSVLGCEKA